MVQMVEAQGMPRSKVRSVFTSDVHLRRASLRVGFGDTFELLELKQLHRTEANKSLVAGEILACAYFLKDLLLGMWPSLQHIKSSFFALARHPHHLQGRMVQSASKTKLSRQCFVECGEIAESYPPAGTIQPT